MAMAMLSAFGMATTAALAAGSSTNKTHENEDNYKAAMAECVKLAQNSKAYTDCVAKAEDQ